VDLPEVFLGLQGCHELDGGMTTKQYLLVLVGFLDGTVVGWIVWTSLRNRNISLGMVDPRLIYWDQNPVAFWGRIGFLVLIGLAILAAVLRALVDS
jgi:hypothetical protein